MRSRFASKVVGYEAGSGDPAFSLDVNGALAIEKNERIP